MQSKFALKSLTVWGVIIGALPVVASLFGASVPPDLLTDLDGWVKAVIEVADKIVVLAGMGLALWGRVRAKTALTLGKPETAAKAVAPLLLIALTIAPLASCAGTAETRATNALAAACDTYATTLDQLTPLRAEGSLSEQQVAKVEATNGLVDPLCAAGSLADPAAAVATVRQGLALLTGIEETL